MLSIKGITREKKVQQKRIKKPQTYRNTNFRLMVSLCLGFIIPILIFFLSTNYSVNTFLPVPLGVTYLLKFLSVLYFFGKWFFKFKLHSLKRRGKLFFTGSFICLRCVVVLFQKVYFAAFLSIVVAIFNF